MRILVVDDDMNNLESISLVLRDMGHEPVPMQDPAAALELATHHFHPLVITDLRMPGLTGLELLARIKEHPATQRADVVLVTGHGDMETAIEALRRGAYDFLTKPISARELVAVVERSAEHQSLLSENTQLRTDMAAQVALAAAEIQRDLEQAKLRLRSVTGIGEVRTASPLMGKVLDDARILHGDPGVPVLIEGETGTGKEVVARLIHYGEQGSDVPFMALNCAAIPRELFESELFGHESGAYTGSRSGGSPGKLEAAAEGTLFLDEVAELPLDLQPKLLRVLEERTFYRLGGLKRRSFRARIICASNRSLAAMVDAGTFRRDLYHRLRVGFLHLPPLRKRPEDIPVLAELFLHRETQRKKKGFKSIAPAALSLLQSQCWSGNVRELENVLERAVLFHDGPTLLPEHIAFLNDSPPCDQPHRVPNTAVSDPAQSLFPGSALTLPDTPFVLDDLINAIIQQTLTRCGGNKSRAAIHLGISRFALHRRLVNSQE